MHVQFKSSPVCHLYWFQDHFQFNTAHFIMVKMSNSAIDKLSLLLIISCMRKLLWAGFQQFLSNYTSNFRSIHQGYILTLFNIILILWLVITNHRYSGLEIGHYSILNTGWFKEDNYCRRSELPRGTIDDQLPENQGK